MTAPYRKKQNDDKLDGWSVVRQGGLADEDQTVHAKNTHTNKLTKTYNKLTFCKFCPGLKQEELSPSGGRPSNKQLRQKSVKA